jgi:predicted permease
MKARVVNMEYLALIRYTVSGLMPLACITMLGATLSYKKIFTESTVKSISTQFSNFFNPIFVFFYITQAVSENNLIGLWPLFFTPLLSVLVGSLNAYLHSLLFGKNHKFARVITSVLTFSNIGNIPIVLLTGMCSDYGPFMQTTAGKRYCAYSNSYISLQVLTYNPILWSYGFSLINRDKEENCLLRNETEENPKNEKNRQSYFIDFLNYLQSPNGICCVLGLLCGLIPGIDYFFDKNNILSCITQTGLSIGISGVIMGQMSLGSSLILNRNHDLDMNKWYIASIFVFKSIVMPVIGFGLIYGLLIFALLLHLLC